VLHREPNWPGVTGNLRPADTGCCRGLLATRHRSAFVPGSLCRQMFAGLPLLGERGRATEAAPRCNRLAYRAAATANAVAKVRSDFWPPRRAAIRNKKSSTPHAPNQRTNAVEISIRVFMFVSVRMINLAAGRHPSTPRLGSAQAGTPLPSWRPGLFIGDCWQGHASHVHFPGSLSIWWAAPPGALEKNSASPVLSCSSTGTRTGRKDSTASPVSDSAHPPVHLTYKDMFISWHYRFPVPGAHDEWACPSSHRSRSSRR
jgi:hypothetical protein